MSDKKNEESKPTNETETVVLEDEDVIVTVENKNDEKLTLNVETVTENYDNLNDNINKTVKFSEGAHVNASGCTAAGKCQLSVQLPQSFPSTSSGIEYMGGVYVINIELISKE